MPAPSTSLATLRPDIQGSFEEFDVMMDRKGYVALQVAPVFETDVVAGTFGRIPIAEMLQQPDTERAPGSGYSSGTWKFTPDTFTTAEHGWEEPIDDNAAKMYRRYFSAEVVAAKRAMGIVLRAQEARVQALVQNTTTFSTGNGNSAAVAVSWKTTASSTPMDDVEAAVQAIYLASGVWPNALIMTRRTFRNVRRSKQITDLIKFGGQYDPTPKNITPNVLAEVFDLPKIIIAGGSKNTANEGQAVAVASLWNDDYVTVCYITDDSEDIQAPTLARIFHWGEDGSEVNGTVETYRDERIRGDRLRVRHQTGEKLMYSALGYMLTGAAQ